MMIIGFLSQVYMPIIITGGEKGVIVSDLVSRPYVYDGWCINLFSLLKFHQVNKYTKTRTFI